MSTEHAQFILGLIDNHLTDLYDDHRHAGCSEERDHISGEISNWELAQAIVAGEAE